MYTRGNDFTKTEPRWQAAIDDATLQAAGAYRPQPEVSVASTAARASCASPPATMPRPGARACAKRSPTSAVRPSKFCSITLSRCCRAQFIRRRPASMEHASWSLQPTSRKAATFPSRVGRHSPWSVTVTAATVLGLLHGRTLHRAVTAEDAAVAGQRAKPCMAVLTLMEEETRVRWHHEFDGMTARRTSQRRTQLDSILGWVRLLHGLHLLTSRVRG